MLKILLAVCMAAAMVIPSKRALHMFQQNRYEFGRYTGWIKDTLGTAKTAFFLPAWLISASIAAGIVLKGNARLIAESLFALCAAAIYFMQERGKSYIKPLVYTSRVKRQIAVMVILSLLCITVVSAAKLEALTLCVCLIAPWLLIYLMALITSPMEAAIRNRYLNEAKQILADHSDLIKIGITGSYGKTSTKNIMQAMISEAYNSLMTPASYNTPMGITRTIREMLKPIHKVFICEMGADHVGDITELMNFIHPSIGVVTTIGPQHLATFGSQENIINEKMQMIELLPSDGIGILNYDNEFIRSYRVKNNVKTVTYGIHYENADYRAVDITYHRNGSRFTVVNGEERIPFETRLLGEHNIQNILSAIAAARYLGVDWKVIQRAAKTMKQVEHRLETKTINGRRFIDDAFNSNPSGSAMALNVLSTMPPKRVVVTPGMIDLGKAQEEINCEFGRLMKERADTVILVGKNQTKPIYEGLEQSGFDMEQVFVFDTVKEALAYVYMSTTPDDTILLENDLPDAFSR
ncbi:MAG: UDP-N-acetylmuramoyl-tripeptide--D-alanyl-D-alanine ligase [Solobacterium sp.]|nr:UDP-N-acetylmuramoyl-tripeptide--D-alanyl-D-alanine ligase [Solobacterium sp.]